jgi:transposase
MGQKRRRFTREFKLEALRLVEGGRSATEVARELGIGVESIYRWKREFAADHQAFPGNGNLKDRGKETEELRREVAQLRAENTFLKKVSAFFAKAGK